MILLNRYWRKRLRHNLLLLLATLVCTAIFWVLFRARRDLISHLSVATAYPAFFLALAAIFMGPWNVLRRRPNPVSFDLRRDTGIWAGVMALLHTGVGLNVHLRGRPWLYFVDQHHRLRTDLFGFSNYTGAVAALLFLLLLSISNDLALRKLGSVKWKSIQRWTYVAIVLTVAHAVAFQGVEKRTLVFQVVIWITTACLALLQLAGYRKRRRLQHAASSAPR